MVGTKRQEWDAEKGLGSELIWKPVRLAGGLNIKGDEEGPVKGDF